MIERSRHDFTAADLIRWRDMIFQNMPPKFGQAEALLASDVISLAIVEVPNGICVRFVDDRGVETDLTLNVAVIKVLLDAISGVNARTRWIDPRGKLLPRG